MVPLLCAENLTIDIGSRRRLFRYGQAQEKLVDDVSFEVAPGRCHALVGSEASGKLPITYALLGLHKLSSGTITLEGEEISGLSRKKFQPFRKHLQGIFWDDFEQFNPRLSLDEAFRQVILVWYPEADKYEILTRIEQVMDLVKLPAANRYLTSLELNRTQRQLAAVARAMICEPKILIAHEPTRGLDVLEQAEVLNRICDVRDQTGLSLLFVTDDLAVAHHMSDTITVLHRGRAVETGPAAHIVTHPEHDYTRRLVTSTVTTLPS